jgi:hypothetical protein
MLAVPQNKSGEGYSIMLQTELQRSFFFKFIHVFNNRHSLMRMGESLSYRMSARPAEEPVGYANKAPLWSAVT